MTKRVWMTLLLLAASLPQAWAQPSTPMSERLVAATPQELPNTPIFDEQGNSQAFNQPSSHWRLVNIWATWCAPCVKELPSLAKLKASWPNDRLEVIAVAWENGKGGTAKGDNAAAKTVQAFYQTHAIQGLPVHYEPTGKLLGALKARGLPVTLLINPQGQEVARYLGEADWDSNGIKLWLTSLMPAAPRSAP